MNATQFLSEAFGVPEQKVDAWFAARTAREAEGWHLDRETDAMMFWGPSPLPPGTMVEGVISRPDGSKGALLKMRLTGLWVQGNTRVLRSLPQNIIADFVA